MIITVFFLYSIRFGPNLCKIRTYQKNSNIRLKPYLLYSFMGVWQGAAMTPLKYCWGLPCSTLLCHMAVLGVAFPQGERPATIFYPLGHPTPYAYMSEDLEYGGAMGCNRTSAVISRWFSFSFLRTE
jgi:hypothetical protein